MSRNIIRQCVKSIYFNGETAMDESLSDFQEIKHNFKGPKTVQKFKTKTRKTIKRIKGQRDIKTALKGKKNELVSYTKEFENVCKKSGIDVNAEQLQVAIALSKSLEAKASEDASTSESQTKRGRIAKIRRTLQEYGFRVPDTKITITKKIKKCRQQYKLITITEEERYQNIRNKYSQILFETLDYKLSTSSSSHSYPPIYNITTNLEYEFMKNNSIFYVDSFANLVEKSTTVGSMLRNWAEIPGRPISPMLIDTNRMDFSEILCSQDELDVILSGPIKSAHKIIASKTEKAKDLDYRIQKGALKCKEINDGRDILVMGLDHDVTTEIDLEISLKNKSILTPTKEVTKQENVTELVSSRSLTVQEQHRSCSPDIFDDEVSCIMEIPISPKYKMKDFTIEGTSMDLTECANNNNVEIAKFIPLNSTKINLDDYMEMTDCAITASQGIKKNVNEIDLTQSPEENSKTENNCDTNYNVKSSDYLFSQRHIKTADCFEIDTEQNNELGQKSLEDDDKSLDNNGPIECIDLINNSNTNGMAALRDLQGEVASDDIDLTQSSKDEDLSVQVYEEVSNKSINLTQSSKSSIDINDLPVINLGNSPKCQINLDDTVILNEEEYLGANGKLKKTVVLQDDEIFDLTQARDDSIDLPNLAVRTASKKCSQSFYEDFIHDHSDSKENIDDIEHENNSTHITSIESIEIDLTQTSDKSTENVPLRPVTIESRPNNSTLGKRDNISIDYDEICEFGDDKDSVNDNNNFNIDKDESLKSRSYNDVVHSNNDIISNCSQSSEVFNLTDKEFDYSLYKSKLDMPIENRDCDFECISVTDDSDNHGGFKKALTHSIVNENYNLEECDLPEINLEKDEKAITLEDRISIGNYSEKVDIAKDTKTVSIVTPKNREYIVKTDEVTPMLDYASLTTPQRNMKLNKYGLKPLKRKRAIQLLTHLYNQTHPVIETYSDDEHPSPSKKRRQDVNLPPQTSPKIQQSPRIPDREATSPKSPRKQSTLSNSKSPRKLRERNENTNSPNTELTNIKEHINTYEIDSVVPNINSVDCDPEDWVFQKREKAKVHTCRVPLHVAFHNYVSSRRSLREAILKYEPVNIDVIHKDLVSYGHRYDPKDLLRFLDKKCITVKTADNNGRNKR